MSVIEKDALIIGAGVIGSSVAMNLAQKGIQNIGVIDFDLEGSLSSSELNAGGVRATWNRTLNIKAAKSSIEYFAKHAEDVGYKACGYLWLCDDKKLEAAKAAREKQIKEGWEVELWDVPTLRKKVPFIDKTDDLAGAVFAPKDGLVNPNLLKIHYRFDAKNKGVEFYDRLWIQSAKQENGKWELTANQFPRVLSEEDKREILSGNMKQYSDTQLKAKTVINCAGAWAKAFAQILGYEIPAKPVRRQVCIFDCRDVDLTQYGMIVDSSGVYFHPEAQNGLAGFANEDEPEGLNFQYDGEEFFQEKIWAPLYERSTAFERLKHLTGWAGLYEVSPDHSSMIGKVEGMENLFEAHSYSGHGVMQSYAAGVALSELIADGKYQTIDMTPLSSSRFQRGESVGEKFVI